MRSNNSSELHKHLDKEWKNSNFRPLLLRANETFRRFPFLHSEQFHIHESNNSHLENKKRATTKTTAKLVTITSNATT